MVATASLLATLAVLEQRSPNYAACEGYPGSSLHATCVVAPSPRQGVKSLVYWLVPKAGSTSARTFASSWLKIWADDADLAGPAPPLYPECKAPDAHTGLIMVGCSDPCARRYVADGALLFGIAREPTEKFLSGYRYTMAPTAQVHSIRCRARGCPDGCPDGPWEKVEAKRPAACPRGAVMVNGTSGLEADGGLARLAEYAASMADDTLAAHAARCPLGVMASRCFGPLGWDATRLQRSVSVVDDDMHVMTQAFKYCAALCEGPGCARPSLLLDLGRLGDELPALAHLAVEVAEDGGGRGSGGGVTEAQRARAVAAVAASVPHNNEGRRGAELAWSKGAKAAAKKRKKNKNKKEVGGMSREESPAALADPRVAAPLCRYLLADYDLLGALFAPPRRCAGQPGYAAAGVPHGAVGSSAPPATVADPEF